MHSRKNDLVKIGLVYLVTGCIGFATLVLFNRLDIVHSFFFADLAMTVTVFACSLMYRNSSVYDAYWSLIPFYFILWWLLAYGLFLMYHQILVLGLISVWSWRLTLNWARSWPGMHHEDWRYRNLAASSGTWYPLVNFFGIHLFPTLMVFACIWPVFYLFRNELAHPLWWYAGMALGILGVLLEYLADNSLRAFRVRTDRRPGEILDQGLWAVCRHPNYLGEMLFWLGLAFIGLAYQAPWYTMVGAAAMCGMFLLISIPMKEKHMAQRYAGYAAYQRRTPLLLPVGRGRT